MARKNFKAVIPEVLNRESILFNWLVSSMYTRLRGYDDLLRIRQH